MLIKLGKSNTNKCLLNTKPVTCIYGIVQEGSGCCSRTCFLETATNHFIWEAVESCFKSPVLSINRRKSQKYWVNDECVSR